MKSYIPLMILVALLLAGAAPAFTENFESFSTTPADLTNSPPGTWTSAGTLTTPNSNLRGANFTVYDQGGTNKFLRIYAWVKPTAISTYSGLGRALRPFGGQFTQEDSFELIFDVLDEHGSNNWNILAIGLQESDGPDDGSREGIAIELSDTHDVINDSIGIHACDLTSFGWQGGPYYNFTNTPGVWRLALKRDQFDQVRLRFDNTMQRVLVQPMSNGMPVSFCPPFGYPRAFTFKNLVIIQSTGTDGCEEITLDIDNLTVSRLYPNIRIVDNFEGFPTTPADIATSPPGTWTTSGTICNPDSGRGANFQVRSAGGTNNYLHAYVNVTSNGTVIGVMDEWAELGRTATSLGTTCTTGDTFSLVIDFRDLTGAITWNGIFFGLQDAAGPDDGSRDGLGITIYDSGFSAPTRHPVFYLVDTTSFGPDIYGANFQKISGWITSVTGDDAFDQVRFTYDNQLGNGKNVLLEVAKNGMVVGWTNWLYTNHFTFGNFVIGQGTGSAGCEYMTVDIDDIRLIKGYGVPGFLFMVK